MSTLSGKQLILSNPKKLVNAKQLEVGKEWFSSFLLNKDEIDLVKNETFSELHLIINDREVTITLPTASRTELHDIVASHF